MIILASIGWIFEVVFGSKKWTSTCERDKPSSLWLVQLSSSSKTRWFPCFRATWRLKSRIHSWKRVVSIQALVLLRYVIGKLWILTFLKHRGFAYFPIIRGGNLCDPSALAHKAIERRSLFFYVQKGVL